MRLKSGRKLFSFSVFVESDGVGEQKEDAPGREAKSGLKRRNEYFALYAFL
jgi:hypothetical protein